MRKPENARAPPCDHCRPPKSCPRSSPRPSKSENPRLVAGISAIFCQAIGRALAIQHPRLFAAHPPAANLQICGRACLPRLQSSIRACWPHPPAAHLQICGRACLPRLQSSIRACWPLPPAALMQSSGRICGPAGASAFSACSSSCRPSSLPSSSCGTGRSGARMQSGSGTWSGWRKRRGRPRMRYPWAGSSSRRHHR